MDEWSLGGTVLHIWEHVEAPEFTVYTAVVRFPNMLRFYRMFPIGGQYHITCDVVRFPNMPCDRETNLNPEGETL